MKSKVLSLTKVFLKNSFQNMETAKTKNQNKKSISMIILYLFVFAYLAAIVGFLSFQMIEGLLQIHQEQIFLGVILLGIGLFVLIQTIFSAISLLYYSKDNEYILPLPLKPSQILMAKTNVLLLTEYIIVAIIGLIPFVIYGYMTGANILYYISMIVVLLVFPIIPILVSSMLVLIVMSFSKFTKNKNRFQLIATILILVVVFGLSFTTSGKQTSQEEMIQLLTKANGLVEMIEGKIPTLKMAIDALANSNTITTLLNLAGILVITGILYAIYILLGQKLYLKGAVGSLSSGKKNKKQINDKKAFKKSNLAKTYVGKEFKILIRNPIFFMQCILPAILFPIMVIVFGILGMKEEGVQSITEIANMIPDKTSIILGAGILVILQFFSMFIYISATAISRDGQNAVFMKYIPVPLNKQIQYKVMPNIIITIIMDVITIAIAEYIFKMPVLYVTLITLVAILIGIMQSYLMLIVDLKKPKLEWNSEYAVVKQNINLMWPVILSFVNVMVVIGLTVLINGKISTYIGMLILGVIYLILAILVKKYIKNNVNKLFEKIY